MNAISLTVNPVGWVSGSGSEPTEEGGRVHQVRLCWGSPEEALALASHFRGFSETLKKAAAETVREAPFFDPESESLAEAVTALMGAYGLDSVVVNGGDRANPRDRGEFVFGDAVRAVSARLEDEEWLRSKVEQVIRSVDVTAQIQAFVVDAVQNFSGGAG